MAPTPHTVVVMVLPDLAAARQAGHDVRSAADEGRFAASDVAVYGLHPSDSQAVADAADDIARILGES